MFDEGTYKISDMGSPFHEKDRPPQGVLLQECVGPPLPNVPYGNEYSSFQVPKPKVNLFLEITGKLMSRHCYTGFLYFWIFLCGEHRTMSISRIMYQVRLGNLLVPRSLKIYASLTIH